MGMNIDPELLRITLEILGLSLIVAFVASTVARRSTLLGGVLAGSLISVILWVVVVFIELRWFARWA